MVPCKKFEGFLGDIVCGTDGHDIFIGLLVDDPTGMIGKYNKEHGSLHIIDASEQHMKKPPKHEVYRIRHLVWDELNVPFAHIKKILEKERNDFPEWRAIHEAKED